MTIVGVCNGTGTACISRAGRCVKSLALRSVHAFNRRDTARRGFFRDVTYEMWDSTCDNVIQFGEKRNIKLYFVFHDSRANNGWDEAAFLKWLRRRHECR